MIKSNAPSNSTPHVVDVLVIGAGPAGLQAALTVARVHRTVLLTDDGQPRNAAATHMHNFVSHDGTAPSEFRATARAQLANYSGVSQPAIGVARLEPVGSGFHAELTDGTEVRATAVVLATGMRDVLPDIAGLDPLFGRLAHHCPFCHGHELAGKRVGIVESPRAGHLSLLLGPIVGELITMPTPSQLIERADQRVEVRAVDGTSEVVDGLFVAPELVQRSELPAQLGLELNPSGAVAIDAFGRTSMPGVFAAGDMAHHRELPMSQGSVISAAAAGAVAGGSAVAHTLT